MSFSEFLKKSKMIKIEQYEFGRMVINSTTYVRDLLIYPNQVIPNWWRNQGHLLEVADLEDHILASKPEILIIGTGKFGMLQVPPEVQKSYKTAGLMLHIQNTEQAVMIFNSISQKQSILAAFHLTC